MGSIYDIQNIKVEENGDWNLSGKTTGDAAILQDIRVRLNEIVGNCFFNLDAGLDIPYFNQSEYTTQEAKVSQIIQATRGVYSLELTNLLKDGTNLYLKYNIVTIFGKSVPFEVLSTN